MRYKIVVSCPELSTAQKVYEMFRKSEIYNSSEIMQLEKIKEVCDECAKN